MNYEELEDWAGRAAQELQEFCDDAQVAAGNPDGEDQLLSVRVLIAEYERIAKGQPAWPVRMVAEGDRDDVPPGLLNL